MTARPASPRRPRSGEKMTEMAKNTRSGYPGAKKVGKTSTAPSVRFRLSEKRFMAQVVEYAELRHWRAWHDRATNAPRRCGNCGEIRHLPRNDAGFLDLILVRRPRLIWAELKKSGEQPTTDQLDWIDALQACGQEVYVWTPDDWREIERVLS